MKRDGPSRPFTLDNCTSAYIWHASCAIGLSVLLRARTQLRGFHVLPGVAAEIGTRGNHGDCSSSALYYSPAKLPVVKFRRRMVPLAAIDAEFLTDRCQRNCPALIRYVSRTQSCQKSELVAFTLPGVNNRYAAKTDKLPAGRTY